MPQNTIKSNNMTLKLTIEHQIDILIKWKKEETPREKGPSSGICSRCTGRNGHIIAAVFLYSSLCVGDLCCMERVGSWSSVSRHTRDVTSCFRPYPVVWRVASKLTR